jgi:hypothetical protein
VGPSRSMSRRSCRNENRADFIAERKRSAEALWRHREDSFLHKARSLSQAVRDHFDQRFTIERVAHDYVRVYNSLAAQPILRDTGGTPRRGAEARPLRAPLGRGITIQPPPLRATGHKTQGMTV